MDSLLKQGSATGLWYELVCEAEHAYGKQLDEEIESYLVFMLQRFAAKPNALLSIFALDFLQSLHIRGEQRNLQLRDLGDKCLLLTGLFPGRVERLVLPLNYFIQLGKLAYHTLALADQKQESLSTLYAELQEQFVILMDTLHHVRELTNGLPQLSLKQAEDLWQQSGSDYADHILKTYADLSKKLN